MEKTAYLILENGRVFKGKYFGYEGTVIGEVVFTTAMTGYIETLTDPSYCGQIVVQTFPLIGNYGIIPEDFESEKPCLTAYIVHEWCREPSNFRNEGDLDAFLKENRIVGLYDIDTRELTKIVREYGVMNAYITDHLKLSNDEKKALSDFVVDKPVNRVSPVEREVFKSESGTYKVALWDYGAKENIKRELLKRGCDVYTFGADAKASDIEGINPDGIMLSNGPGDPAENTEIIKELKILCEKKYPIFGICLGHQLLALSQGAKSEKLKYGHRGGNQPALEKATGRVYITSQNHGYAILPETLPKGAVLSFENANDKTCEGIEYTDMPAFTVQFHPEACGGPHDTNFLFDKFMDLIKENQNAVK